MTRRISLITAVAVGAVLAFAAPAFGDSRASDQPQADVRVSPDAGDRAAAARQAEQLAMLDARERSMTLKSSTTTAVMSDPVRDDYFRIDSSGIATPTVTASSGRDIEWPQIGIVFASGVLLAVALLLALRMPRVRQPAH